MNTAKKARPIHQSHLSEAAMVKRLKNTLSPEEALLADAHLEICYVCSHRFEWVEKNLEMLGGEETDTVAAPTLLELISTDITELFVFRAELKAASGEDGIKRKLADGRTQIAVHSDSAGRLWLRVTSTAEEFRNGSFKLDIEPAPSVLTFTEVEPGLYSARVCVDEEVAAELAKGAVPKLTQLPTPEG